MGEAPEWNSQESNLEPGVAAFLHDWIQLDSRARLVLDAKRTVVWRNEAAAELLNHQLPIHEDSGLLAAHRATAEEEIEKFLMSAPASGALLCLPPVDGGRPAVLRAIIATKLKTRRVVAVELHAPDDGDPIVYAGYQHFYGLTPAEHKVLSAMSEGATVEQIADKHRGSIGTARTHMRNIYAKMGVSSREGLFGKLARFRIM